MSNDNLVVFARNLPEHLAAQAQMTEWANNQLMEAMSNFEDVTANLENAKTNKWKLTGWQTQQRIARKKVEYYEKIHAALAAGYVIVPDFPIDIFAIRTRRNYPLQHYTTTDHQWDNTDRTQRSEVLELGEGEYVDSEPVTLQRKQIVGETVSYLNWADEFKDVDFPVKAAKPVILEETGKALLLKIFDEVGCNPGRPGWSAGRGTNRGADPMVIGRVLYKRPSSYGVRNDKSVSFLIAWWLKASDITI